MLIIRRTIIFILILLLVLPLYPSAYAENEPNVSASCAIVMGPDGEVLYEKNADEIALIASTTKIMTALVAIEHCDLDAVVTVQRGWCNVEGSSMYLTPGQKLTVRELLCGLLLVSGNDAAVALAEYTAGSIQEFAALMNEKAQALGMDRSSFMNPHGLNEDGHHSTARDMAKLMNACMDNEDFAEISAMKSTVVGKLTFYNHNKLLSMYGGCIGGKTGYTKASGRCLVSCCDKSGMRLVCVTLGAPDDWNDHISLYNYAYSTYSVRDPFKEVRFTLPVISGDCPTVELVPDSEQKLLLLQSAEIVLTAEMPRFVFAPFHSGEVAGRVTATVDGQVVARCRLIFLQGADVAIGTNAFIKRILERA